MWSVSNANVGIPIHTKGQAVSCGTMDHSKLIDAVYKLLVFVATSTGLSLVNTGIALHIT